jgi:hypothetical protein
MTPEELEALARLVAAALGPDQLSERLALSRLLVAARESRKEADLWWAEFKRLQESIGGESLPGDWS